MYERFWYYLACAWGFLPSPTADDPSSDNQSAICSQTSSTKSVPGPGKDSRLLVESMETSSDQEKVSSKQRGFVGHFSLSIWSCLFVIEWTERTNETIVTRAVPTLDRYFIRHKAFPSCSWTAREDWFNRCSSSLETRFHHQHRMQTSIHVHCWWPVTNLRAQWTINSVSNQEMLQRNTIDFNLDLSVQQEEFFKPRIILQKIQFDDPGRRDE